VKDIQELCRTALRRLEEREARLAARRERDRLRRRRTDERRLAPLREAALRAMLDQQREAARRGILL